METLNAKKPNTTEVLTNSDGTTLPKDLEGIIETFKVEETKITPEATQKNYERIRR